MTRRHRASQPQIKAARRLWQWLHDGTDDPPDPANDCGPLSGVSEPRENKNGNGAAMNSDLPNCLKQDPRARTVRKIYSAAVCPGLKCAAFHWLAVRQKP
jgi:hypothetical protein